jgi:hypothetical protein
VGAQKKAINIDDTPENLSGTVYNYVTEKSEKGENEGQRRKNCKRAVLN